MTPEEDLAAIKAIQGFVVVRTRCPHDIGEHLPGSHGVSGYASIPLIVVGPSNVAEFRSQCALGESLRPEGALAIEGRAPLNAWFYRVEACD